MNEGNGSGGLSAGAALGILFVGLKLGGVIDWSWWWVTAPFWAPLAVALAVAGVVVLVRFMAELVGVLRDRLRSRRSLNALLREACKEVPDDRR